MKSSWLITQRKYYRNNRSLRTFSNYRPNLSVSPFLQMMQSCLSMSSVTKIIKLYSWMLCKLVQ